jgi:hypothetical protein
MAFEIRMAVHFKTEIFELSPSIYCVNLYLCRSQPRTGYAAQPRSPVDVRGTYIRPAQYCGPDSVLVHKEPGPNYLTRTRCLKPVFIG